MQGEVAQSGDWARGRGRYEADLSRNPFSLASVSLSLLLL